MKIELNLKELQYLMALVNSNIDEINSHSNWFDSVEEALEVYPQIKALQAKLFKTLKEAHNV